MTNPDLVVLQVLLLVLAQQQEIEAKHAYWRHLRWSWWCFRSAAFLEELVVLRVLVAFLEALVPSWRHLRRSRWCFRHWRYLGGAGGVSGIGGISGGAGGASGIGGISGGAGGASGIGGISGGAGAQALVASQVEPQVLQALAAFQESGGASGIGGIGGAPGGAGGASGIGGIGGSPEEPEAGRRHRWHAGRRRGASFIGGSTLVDRWHTGWCIRFVCIIVSHFLSSVAICTLAIDVHITVLLVSFAANCFWRLLHVCWA